MNCWEFMNCTKHFGKSDGRASCPAYPDKGRQCASVAGTQCGGAPYGYYAIKLMNCIKCDYYNSPHYDASYLRRD